MNTSWRKSSYSAEDANRVEVAHGLDLAGIRDSKDPGGGHLEVPVDACRAFLAHLV